MRSRSELLTLLNEAPADVDRPATVGQIESVRILRARAGESGLPMPQTAVEADNELARITEILAVRWWGDINA